MSVSFSRRKDRDRNFYLRLLGSMIGLGLLLFLIWQNWSGFINALQSLPVDLVLILLILAIVSRLMVTIRWFVLLKVVEPDFHFRKALKLSFVGLFATNVLPSTIGGDVIKLSGGVYYGLDSAGVTASLIVDRLVGMTTMATFLPFGVCHIIGINSFSTSLEAGSSIVFFSNIWRKIVSFFERIICLRKLWLKQPSRLIFAAIFSYIHMACTFTMVSLILQTLGDPISWWMAGGLWVLVYFITLIPISINGLGLQEASLALIYSSFAGVSDTNSLVLALLMRVFFLIVSLPGAFLLPAVLSGNRTETIGSQTETVNDG